MSKPALTDYDHRCKIAFQENEGAVNQIVCAIKTALKDSLGQFRFHGVVQIEVKIIENDVTDFQISTTRRNKVK